MSMNPYELKSALEQLEDMLAAMSPADREAAERCEVHVSRPKYSRTVVYISAEELRQHRAALTTKAPAGDGEGER